MNDYFIVEAVPIPTLEHKITTLNNVFNMTSIQEFVLGHMGMKILLIATCVVHVVEESLIQL